MSIVIVLLTYVCISFPFTDLPQAGKQLYVGDHILIFFFFAYLYRHPLITLFHLLFKVLALLAYELCGWFSNGFIGSFIVIVILLSMDFWTVKNITG